MNRVWHDVFGGWYDVTLDGLENSIRNCSDDLWHVSMWNVAKDPAQPRALTADGTPHPLGNEVLSAVWKVAWHGLLTNEFNLAGRPPNFRLNDRFAHLYTPPAPGVVARGEVVPVDVPSRDDLIAYLQHNRDVVKARLAAAREVGDGQSTLGPWSGPTSVLLNMFHGNACHLVSHSTELFMFIQQRR